MRATHTSKMEETVIRKLILTLSVSTFVIIVPFLEISETHVFNPLWPSHARLHEVWQLLTNFLLGVMALWLAWRRDRVRLASGIGILIVGGFLGAYLLSGFYGGSMQHTDGSEIALGGLNVAVVVMALAFMGLVASFVPSGRSAAS